MISPKQPDSTDKLVGHNIRIQRLATGLSQTELAQRLGVTFQQVQKYERGVNRIGCGRLFQIARILGVHVMDFFDGSGAGKPTEARNVRDLISEPQAFHLLEAFSEISDRRLRRSVVELVKKIARAKAGLVRTAEGWRASSGHAGNTATIHQQGAGPVSFAEARSGDTAPPGKSHLHCESGTLALWTWVPSRHWGLSVSGPFSPPGRGC
jgi:transcriptional regulator with XRE-family HTH domain